MYNFFLSGPNNNKKDFPKEVVEETPLLETLKTRWSKAPENIHAGSILHWVKAKGTDQCNMQLVSLAQQCHENKDLHFLGLFLNFLALLFLLEHLVLTSLRAGHTGIAGVLGCCASSMCCETVRFSPCSQEACVAWAPKVPHLRGFCSCFCQNLRGFTILC